MDALNTIPAELDHLIITVPDLEAGVAAVEEATGVRAIPGGSHPGRGTANFLLGLAPTGWPEGAHTYLEILGPDPQQEKPADGTLPLDAHLATEPTLQTWAIHPPAFLAKIAAANTVGIDFGEVQDMARDTAEGDRLEWRLTTRSPLPRSGCAAVPHRLGRIRASRRGGPAHPRTARIPCGIAGARGGAAGARGARSR
jgi:hypothetical protein